MDEFLEQIEKYRDEFYRYIYRMAWDSSAADDVFSEAVLAAYTNRAKFRPGSNFRAWMYRIITNKCYVANRYTSRTGISLDADDGREFAAVAERPEYDNVLENTEEVLEECSDEILRAFKRLSEPERACLLLRSVESFSYKEISGILEIPIGTVMTHLSRGRGKLRGQLLDYAVEAGVVKPKLSLLNNKDGQTQDLEVGNG